MASERILAVGAIVAGGDVQWHISPLPAEVVDVPLQQLIDEAEQTAQYEDDMEDRSFWSRGGW
jgi:hypothetical protein